VRLLSGSSWEKTVSEYTTDKTDDYLTMARIMEKETEKWTAKVLASSATGSEVVKARQSYQAGFMAGFCFRFTGDK